MRALLCRRLSRSLYEAAASSSSSSFSSSSSSSCFRRLGFRTLSSLTSSSNHTPLSRTLLASSPWSATQLRGAKFLGSDVRPGNCIRRKGRIYQVLKAQHTQHGRGGATIQVELRDIDSGSKVNEKFRTDETIESVFVEEKSFLYLYTDDDNIVLMEPGTFSQMEVSKDLFGKAAAYLKDDMKVTLHLCDGKPTSASVPKRVTCTVVEAQVPVKGSTATPQYKRVSLDNGLTVLAPPFVLAGDSIVIDTTDDSYITRA
ncbi:elongation factor P [Vitis riparia]|uniref:elongation factor P n=1 Tax=Vitis riparia TaxID=96939 RepID=UPI00155B19DC|nr:elongation factor P [Vitis riparia]